MNKQINNLHFTYVFWPQTNQCIVSQKYYNEISSMMTRNIVHNSETGINNLLFLSNSVEKALKSNLIHDISISKTLAMAI